MLFCQSVFDLDRLEVLGSPVPVVDGIATEPLDGTAPYDVSQNGTLAFITGGPRSPNNRIIIMDRQGRRIPLNVEPRAYRRLRISPSGNAVALDVYGATIQTWILDLKRNVLEPATQR